MYSILAVAFLIAQDTIPLKPKEEFEVKLDYQLKNRPPVERNTVELGVQPRSHGRSTSSVLPYLVLEVKMLALPEAKTRVAITNNASNRPVYKRVTLNSVLELDMGFTADMIDRVKPHEYTITFTDADRNPVNRIVISIDQDGSFFVNGEKRGRF